MPVCSSMVALPGHALQHVSMSTETSCLARVKHAMEPATMQLLDMGRRSQVRPGRATLFLRSTGCICELARQSQVSSSCASTPSVQG